MGMIKAYSLIIPKTELSLWLDKGWVEVPDFHSFHYAPSPSETVVLSKPLRLSDVDATSLVGRTILAYDTHYGTYGMGGPGFLGFTLSDSILQRYPANTDVLVYAVWGSGNYTLIDNRVVECHPRFYGAFHPWISDYVDSDAENWDDLTPALVGGLIDAIQVRDEVCTVTVTQKNDAHIIEFLKNDSRLPPHGNESPRQDAFDTGKIADYMLFQIEKGVLHV
jgi:hypothetical protein